MEAEFCETKKRGDSFEVAAFAGSSPSVVLSKVEVFGKLEQKDLVACLNPSCFPWDKVVSWTFCSK